MEKLIRWMALSDGCFLALRNRRFSRFSSPLMGTLIKSARMPPARMGRTRSTSSAAKARTVESRSSATKSVTPTTVTSRYCLVFGSMTKFLSRSRRLKFAKRRSADSFPYCNQKKRACQDAGKGGRLLIWLRLQNRISVAGIPTTLVSIPQNHYNRGKRQSRKGDISWEKQKSAAFSAF